MKKYFTLPNIITVVALIFAVYSHLSNRKERRPVWTSSPTILIYNQNQTENNFILLNKDSTEINKNIYTQEIVIWNAGNETIAKSDIRVPLGLVFSKNSNLIDYKILEEKSSVNNNFKLEVFGDSLILNWKYFDPGEGVRFKHIYSSDGKSHPKITGKVLGERITKIVNTRQNALQFFILLVLSICSFIFTKGAANKKDNNT